MLTAPAMIKFLLTLTFAAIAFNPLSSQEHYLLVGTYTGGKSEGIYVYRFNSKDHSHQPVSHIKASNPSFLAISPDQRFVYAVHENGGNHDGGEVSAYRFDNTNGTLQLINTRRTGGDHPCFVDVDKSGKWVFVANYSSGTLSVLPVRPDGSLGEAVTKIQHEGSGTNKDRQAGPHVHATRISPDNKWLFVPDLGTDKLMIYSFDENTGSLKTGSQPYIESEPGAGPRHIDFHPSGKYIYLIEELTGHVVVYLFHDGRLIRLQRVSSLPPDQKGFAGSADIHVSPDGKHLYASNRGNFDNIAIFKIKKDGRLDIKGFQSTLGKAPRNFNFDPSAKYILAGNQDSDEIVVFKRKSGNGLLQDTGDRIAAGKPVCLKWITK